MSAFNRSVKTLDSRKAAERKMRTKGYDDGYAGRPAALSLMVYQQSYRRGQAARASDAPSMGDPDYIERCGDAYADGARKGDAA